MERLSDRNSGNLGTDLFGEKDTLLDGLGQEVSDPSVGIRMFLNIIVLLLCLPLPTRQTKLISVGLAPGARGRTRPLLSRDGEADDASRSPIRQ